MDEQEMELLEGFRKLVPAAKNTILTAVLMAVTAEDAVRREMSNVGNPFVKAEEIGSSAMVTIGR